MSNTLAINIKDLHKKYKNGPHALKGVNLCIGHGDFYALLGVNGAGKSTLINIVTDLVIKTKGDVKVYGVDIDQDINKVKSMIGIVPQEFNFDYFGNVIDIVTTVGGFYGLNVYDAKERAKKVLNDLGLGDKLYSQAKKLSGGMKRRLMIARGLIHQPKLLILDEPTAGVDVDLRNGMWEYLKDINQKGTTILLTTHYLEEVEQLCKNASILKDGKVALEGSVSSLLHQLKSETYVIQTTEAFNQNLNNKYKEVFGENLVKIEHDNMFIKIGDKYTFQNMLDDIRRINIKIASIRPKGNRLEELFLNTIK